MKGISDEMLAKGGVYMVQFRDPWQGVVEVGGHEGRLAVRFQSGREVLTHTNPHGQVVNATYELVDGRPTITLYPGGRNLPTVAHELGHFKIELEKGRLRERFDLALGRDSQDWSTMTAMYDDEEDEVAAFLKGLGFLVPGPKR